ncbi:class I glutamine amidotransferase-like protein [Hypoxylon crocopeplum]|nr:class I glutamine amidotransferase-like protein [Hypoxylon crocopeplum]
MASESKNSTSGQHTVKIGVFIPGDCQVLDAASVDIMGTMSHECMSLPFPLFVSETPLHRAYSHLKKSAHIKGEISHLQMVSQVVPKAVIDLAPSVQIYYVGSVQAGEPIKLTANETILATHHYGDAEVAPGKLDIVLVPGPDPYSPFDQGAVRWLAAQGNTEGVDILSVCTGIFLCGEAGLLKGRSACGPRGIQEFIKTKGYGEKELVGHKYRWTQDGNLWSSGGVTNGNDLVAAYCRASPHHFPKPIVEIACETTDVGDRAREYGKGQSAFVLTMILNVFRAWLMSFAPFSPSRGRGRKQT